MSARTAALRAAAEAADPFLAHREKAAADLARYEAQVLKATRKAVRSWLKVARAATLGGTVTAAADDVAPNAGAIPGKAFEWVALVDQHIIAAIDRLLGERFAELLNDDRVVSARPWQERYLAEVRNRMDDVPAATFEAVRAEVQLGIDHGDGIPAIRDRIATALSADLGGSDNDWMKRAQTIARTETIGAYNGGQLAASRVIEEATGEVLDKLWLSTIDARTRKDHFRADGQRVRLGEPFQVGHADLDHPGDPSAPPGQVINCRCTMLELAADEETPDTAERGFRDRDEVQAEIDARAADDQVRAYDDPEQQRQQEARRVEALQAAPDSPDSGPDPVTASAPPEGPTMPRRTWRSKPVLAPFGKPTGDGRIFKVGSLTSRDLPLPLLYQESTSMGHDGSTTVGRILTVDFTDAGIVSTGDYLDDPALAEAVGKAIALVESGLGGVSVDLDSVTGSLVDEDGNPVDMEWLMGEWERGENPVVLEQVDEGRLIGVTQVATPAFAEAAIELDPIAEESTAPTGDALSAALEDSSGTAVEVGARVEFVALAGTEKERTGKGTVTAVNEEDETVTIEEDAEEPLEGETITVNIADVTVIEAVPEDVEEDAAAQLATLTAAAGSVFRPPAWAYEDPKLTGPTALTVTDEGRVFGHVAVWGTCHVGYPGQCVEPPRSPSEYGFFHVGAVRLDDGTRIAVGNLTLGGGHADPKLAWRQAAAHYDRTGFGIATVRAYEDDHGIAVAGWLNPGATEAQIAELERSPLSGDWREIGGELDMIGALAVNSGGFPVPRYSTGPSGDRTALVAAPGVRPAARKRTAAGLGDLRARLRREVLADVKADLKRRARLDAVVASVGLDTRSRLADVLDGLDD